MQDLLCHIIYIVKLVCLYLSEGTFFEVGIKEKQRYSLTDTPNYPRRRPNNLNLKLEH